MVVWGVRGITDYGSFFSILSPMYYDLPGRPATSAELPVVRKRGGECHSLAKELVIFSSMYVPPDDICSPGPTCQGIHKVTGLLITCSFEPDTIF